MNKLAQVGHTEGIEHSFIRQIAQNPQAFGYHGDLANHADIHRFAGNMAHQIAIENHYVDVEKGTEVRIRFDEKNPSVFILKPDHSVTEVNTADSKYIQNTRDLVKQALQKKDEAAASIHQSLLNGHASSHPDQVKGLANIYPGKSAYNGPLVPREMTQTEIHGTKGLEYKYPSASSHTKVNNPIIPNGASVPAKPEVPPAVGQEMPASQSEIDKMIQDKNDVTSDYIKTDKLS